MEMEIYIFLLPISEFFSTTSFRRSVRINLFSIIYKDTYYTIWLTSYRSFTKHTAWSAVEWCRVRSFVYTFHGSADVYVHI